MSKLAQAFAKYVIYAKMDASGIVEKPDVIGAIFGQTEGLLGTDLDLRELQRTGRIGRIEVEINSSRGKSTAEIVIPSSLDSTDTSLIAATLETIDKVGPCESKVTVKKVEDLRATKRNFVLERAKEILKDMMEDGVQNTQQLSESIKESVMSLDISEYKGLSCGKGIQDFEDIIIVEGRADVINLLKNGVKNVIAIDGSNVPDAVKELTRQKTTTAFLDGDRGGDLTLKKLFALAEIDYVARADTGKEVEELAKKEIYKALRSKVAVKQEKQQIDEIKMRSFSSLLEDLVGTRAAYLVDSQMQIISKIPITEIADILNSFNNVYAMVYDGKISQTIVDMAAKKKLSCVVGTDRKDDVRDERVRIITLKDIKSAGY